MSWKKIPFLLLRSSKSLCINGILQLYIASQVNHLGLDSLIQILYINGCMYFYVYRRIKILRMEIAKVRSQREETEKQLKEKKFSSSKIQKSVKKVQEEVKVNFVYSKYL